MSIVKPRNRLIYFRVSEDEYQQYNQICGSVGFRSISDFARSAMQNMAKNGQHQKDPVCEKLTTLEILVADMNRKIHELAVSVGRPLSQDVGQDSPELTAS